MNILIIDDDQINNFVLKNVIQRSYTNTNVEIKLDGKSGFNYLARIKDEGKPFPDIIFVDIYMPIMTGFEFLDDFESHFAEDHFPVIFMISSSLSKEDQMKANSYKCVQGYITKPLINNNIHFIVDSYILNQ